MRRQETSILEDLIYAPWWISGILLVIGNIVIRYVIPAFYAGERSKGAVGQIIGGGITNAMPFIGNMFSFVMIFIMVFSYFMGKRRARDRG